MIHPIPPTLHAPLNEAGTGRIRLDVVYAEALCAVGEFIAFSDTGAAVRAKRFIAVTQLTPMIYVIRCRVRAAQTLLAEGLSRTETAHRCGFYDTSHMNRILEEYEKIPAGDGDLGITFF